MPKPSFLVTGSLRYQTLLNHLILNRSLRILHRLCSLPLSSLQTQLMRIVDDGLRRTVFPNGNLWRNKCDGLLMEMTAQQESFRRPFYPHSIYDVQWVFLLPFINTLEETKSISSKISYFHKLSNVGYYTTYLCYS